MTAVGFTESVVELAALDWFREIGYTVVHGPDIAPDGPFSDHANFQSKVLVELLSGRVRAPVPAQM